MSNAQKGDMSIDLDDELLDHALLEVNTVVRDIVPEFETSGRVKSQEAVFNKLRRNETKAPAVHDRVGIRVIVERVEECFAVIDEVHASMKSLGEFFDDYITCPKHNGYQSLHTTVHVPNGRFFELQVRTREMHFRAEQGSAAHLLYKRSQATDVQPRPPKRFDSLPLVSRTSSRKDQQ